MDYFVLPVRSFKNVLDFSEQHVSTLNFLINKQPCIAFSEYFSTILTFVKGRSRWWWWGNATPDFGRIEDATRQPLTPLINK